MFAQGVKDTEYESIDLRPHPDMDLDFEVVT